MAGAAAHNKEMKDFVRAKVFMSAIKKWKF